MKILRFSLIYIFCLVGYFGKGQNTPLLPGPMETTLQPMDSIWLKRNGKARWYVYTGSLSSIESPMAKLQAEQAIESQRSLLAILPAILGLADKIFTPETNDAIKAQKAWKQKKKNYMNLKKDYDNGKIEDCAYLHFLYDLLELEKPECYP